MERIKEETIEALRDLIDLNVRLIVDHPEDVEVNVVPATFRLLAELSTHSRDVGQVVGKEGHVIMSIRSLISALAGKHNVEMGLDFLTERENARRKNS